MKRMILGGILAAATLAGTLAFTSAAVTATDDIDEPPVEEACYAQVPTYGDVIEKETRERTRTYTEGTDGQHYSWTGGNLDTDNPPAEVPPSDPKIPSNWQANTSQEPHDNGNGNPATWVNASLHYTAASEQHASWFYYQAGTPSSYGEWTEWSKWTDWPDAGPLNDDGRDRGPAAHGEQTSTYEREYRYVVVDQYQTGTENGERIPCEEQPADNSTKREVAAPCIEVGQTTTTVTVYGQDWTSVRNEDFKWDAVKDGNEYVAKTYERPLTDAEKARCPVPEATVLPTTQPPTNDVASKPPVVAPAAAPVVAPPAAAPPAAPAVVASAVPTQLPATGSSSWVTALIALVTLLGGTALLRVSRRPTD